MKKRIEKADQDLKKKNIIYLYIYISSRLHGSRRMYDILNFAIKNFVYIKK